MPVITPVDHERFELQGVEFTSLVRPGKAGAENAVWWVRVESCEPGPPHVLDRDEVLVARSGEAVASLDGTEHAVGAGDTILVPAGTPFALRAAAPDEAFVALAILPAGATACLDGGEPFVPPWCA